MSGQKRARERRSNEAETGVERELKFIVDLKTLKAAIAAPFLGGGAAPAWRRLESIYFDNDEGDLSRARVALRLRRSADGWVMGLKRAAGEDRGAFEREETEVTAPSGEPDLSLFPAEAARVVTAVVGKAPLAPRFGSDIRRATRMIEVRGATIEAAFDEGFLFAGDRRAATAELELELKAGAPAILFALGLEVVEAFPVRLGVQSKAERAHALMSSEPPEPARAGALAIRPETTLDETIAAVMRSCLAHFLGNLPAFESGDKVEATHQMRVAMRRLRAGFGLFGRAFPCAEFDALGAESKRIGAALGKARDWDVFAERLSRGELSRFAGEPGFEALLGAAEAKADRARAAIARTADGRSIARFALRLERLAAARGWRDGAPEEAFAALDAPARAFATRELALLSRKIKRRGRHFGALTPQARHRLRIAVKHIRYAIEFLGPTFAAQSDAERYAQSAAALQDALGALNDAAIALRLVRALGADAGAPTAYAAGVVSGWCARAAEGDPAGLKKTWRSLAEASPFWREQE